MSKTKYQSEIDGLRAIAVLSVIIFHINDAWLPGGFVGVDIFFVISGYLITSNIFPQLESEDFSFKNFYTRRIKRLLPSLYATLAVTSLVATILFLPDDILTFNKSVQNILFFWGNHFFARGRDYFSPLSNETPLLHTWSLAIEEQFYFIWPILILVFVKMKLRRNQILIVAFFLSILSFIIGSLLIYKNYNTWAYYSFPSRYGELLLGAILAILNSKAPKKQSALLTLIGLIIVFACFILISERSHFPGFGAIAPCLGTLLLLYSQKNFFNSWLSIGPLILIGQMSYQLYLWHWPILAFARYLTGQYALGNNAILIALGLMFLLSYFTWKFIETPLRYSKLSVTKSFMFLYFLPAILLILFIKTSEPFFFKSIFFSNIQLNSYGENICHGKIIENQCIKGDLIKKPRIFATGDSHAAHLNSFFNEIGKSEHWSAFVVTGSSCSPVLHFDENIISDLETRNSCKKLKEYFIHQIDQFEIVAFASRWDFQLGFSKGEISDPNYLKKLEQTFAWLNERNKKVLLFSQVPMRKLSPQRAELFTSRLKVATASGVEESVVKANKIVKELSKKFTNIIWIDLYSDFGFFDDGLYYQGKPIYKDKSHLNTWGATALAKHFQNTRKNDQYIWR